MLKCTTLPLRDADGSLIGALCINIDISAINRATGVLGPARAVRAAGAEPRRDDELLR